MELVILAAGGLGREVAAEVARSSGRELVGFLDDSAELEGASIAGRPVLGGLESATDLPDAHFLVCAGKGAARRAIVQRLGALGVPADRFATLIAGDVYVPPSCSVGPGSILLTGTVLTADVTVGAHVVTMPGVVLTHDNCVKDYATLCARTTLGGNVTIGEAAYLGMGSLVRENRTVGPDSLLGMGAVLLEDLPPGEIWAGVPAAPVRRNNLLAQEKSA